MIKSSAFLEQEKNKARLLFVLVSLISFGPLFFQEGIFNIDDYLIEDLKQVTGLGDYFVRVGSGKISDIQPLRDLSYAWDLAWQSLLGLPTFIVTSFIIWMATGWVLLDIFERFRPLKNTFALLLAVALLCHPIFGQSVILNGARKHLLALFFGTLFLREVFFSDISDRPSWKANFYFLLSLLSHPINIGLSLWYAIDLKLRREKTNGEVVRSALPFVLVSGLMGLINYWWYFQVYSKTLGVNPQEGGFSIADTLLAYGRYLVLIIIPDQYATFYGKQSVMNLVGLLSWPVVIWVFFKKMGAKVTTSFMALFFISLVPVTYKIFWIFVAHRWAMMACVSLLLLVWMLTNDLIKEPKRVALVIVSLVLVAFTSLNLKNALLFKNPSQVLKTNYLVDANCINLHYYVRDLFVRHKNDKAASLGQELVQRKCIWMNKNNRMDSKVLYAKILAYAKDEKKSEREENLKRLGEEALYFKFALGVFYLNNSAQDKAFDLLNEVMSHNERLKAEDTFVHTFLKHCQKANTLEFRSACAELESKVQ